MHDQPHASQTEPVLAHSRPEDTFPLPVSLLVALVNELAADNLLRKQILDYIKTHKSNFAAGFYTQQDGSLAFDRALLWEAIYRGKIETYFKAAREAHERLRKDLEMVSGFHEKQGILLESLSPEMLSARLGRGKTPSLEATAFVEKLLPILNGSDNNDSDAQESEQDK